MSIDVFSIHCDALDSAKLAGFKGTEGLNRPFELDVFFTVPLGTDVKGAVGARATLTADRDDGRGPMCWHGILASIRLLHETAERALYRAVLVPKLWLLRRHVRSFVHTKKKIDAFTADTLEDGGLSRSDFELHTNAAAYPQEEFVCQYRESHLDFLHRWFEREGLYYYFEHPEGAGASERMIVVDDKALHHPLFGEGHVRYFPAAGHDGSAGECFRELSADFELLPASVLISDYNYANPAAPVAGEKAVSQAGQGKIREYGYRVFTEAEAKRLAQVKAQSMACRELVLTASGTYLGLRAGYTFELQEGPGDLPAKYLAIEVRHAGAVGGASPMVRRYTGLDANETYRVDVVAIPSNVQYRAPQSTAWPRIYGFENGTVDGPGESQYAQIDEQGRYLVRFKFDVGDLPDGSTSTYLRMMQPHGGSTEGWHFPLRKGTEVMVSFQGGDPDRPVIAGVVPNAVQPSNVTAKNHTQNVLRTGGGNFMVMEDTDGRQYIDMGTPTENTRFFMGDPDPDPGFIGPPEADWPPRLVPIPGKEPGKVRNGEFDFSYFMKTDSDAGFKVGGSWWQDVGGALFVNVTDEARLQYGGAHTLLIGKDSNEFYGTVRNTTIQSGRYDKILGGGMKQDVHGGYLQRIEPVGKQLVNGSWTHEVTSEALDKYGAWSTVVDGAWNATVGGDIHIGSNGTITLASPSKIVLQAPDIEKVTGKFGEHAGVTFLSFGTSNSFGVQKYEFASLSFAHTPFSMSATGMKLENVGCQAGKVITEMNATATKIAEGALGIFSLGLTKLG